MAAPCCENPDWIADFRLELWGGIEQEALQILGPVLHGGVSASGLLTMTSCNLPVIPKALGGLWPRPNPQKRSTAAWTRCCSVCPPRGGPGSIPMHNAVFTWGVIGSCSDFPSPRSPRR